MKVRFWGTRGSIATPEHNTLKFGGNTSCVELTTDAGETLIFDCGTGARQLGMHLMAKKAKPIRATILLSHTHWDHIQGFPFFVPAFVPGNEITVCGPEGSNKSLPEVLAGQMEYTYFPVDLGQLGARLIYKDLREGVHDINGVRIRAQYLNHPAVTLGYRVEHDGASVMYLCDHELFADPLWRADAQRGKIASILHAGDRRHAEFMTGADLVIHDAQYTPEEYPSKKTWGHSTYEYAVELAAAAGVRRLALTHHDPMHTDENIQKIEEKAAEAAARIGSSMEVFCAREGSEITVNPVDSPGRQAPASNSAIPGALGKSLRILIVDDDEDLRLLARAALKKGGFHVEEAESGAEGLRMIGENKPDLLVLDLNMPSPNGLEVLRTLRGNPGTAGLPVLVLTAYDDEGNTRAAFDLGATDYLAKPFSVPQLNARVRACLSRA